MASTAAKRAAAASPEETTDLTFGLGAQYEVNRNVGVRLEWQRYTDFGGGALGRVSDQDVLWLNAIYRFR